MTLDTSDTQQVSLKRELEVLRKYLEIEQTRFGPRLTVGIFAEPETLDAQVPESAPAAARRKRGPSWDCSARAAGLDQRPRKAGRLVCW